MLKYIDEMFTSIDGNENGLVSIDELVEYYAMSILDIREDIEELQERMQDSQSRSNHIDKKLVELRATEKSTGNPHPTKAGRTVMVGSILSVHIINAENLSEVDINTVVKAQVGS